MTESEATELIMERAVAQWATATGLAPDTLVLENEAIPESGTFGMVSLGAVLKIPLTAGPKATRKAEFRAPILVKLWTPENAGRGPLSALADAVRTIFEGEQLSNGTESVTILTGSLGSVASDGGFYMGLLSFPARWYGTY